MASEQDQHALSGLMWRFLVLDDHEVDRFLIRDADSLISKREVAAIEAWQQSDKRFHLMRDYFSHTELLLAGMWGGRRLSARLRPAVVMRAFAMLLLAGALAMLASRLPGFGV